MQKIGVRLKPTLQLHHLVILPLQLHQLLMIPFFYYLSVFYIEYSICMFYGLESMCYDYYCSSFKESIHCYRHLFF